MIIFDINMNNSIYKPPNFYDRNSVQRSSIKHNDKYMYKIGNFKSRGENEKNRAKTTT